MNNFYIKWAILSIKRNIKSISFWTIIVIFCLISSLFVYVGNKQKNDVNVLIYVEDSDIGFKIADNLYDNDISGFNFTPVNSRDEMETLIIRGEAPCGLIFTEEFDDAIKNNDPDGEIVIRMSSDSFDGYLVEEIVYPYILTEGGDVLLKNYLEDYDEDKEAIDYAIDSYHEIQSNMGLNIYKVIEIDTEDISESGNLSLDYKKICYLILITISIIFIAWNEYKNSYSLYKSLSKIKRTVLCFEYSVITIAMISVAYLLSGIFVKY